MPPSVYTIDPGRRLVCVTLLDASTPAEIVEFCEGVLHDPLYQSGFSFLVDRRQLTKPPRADTVRALAAFVRQYASQLGPCRIAIVNNSVAGQWWPWRTGMALLAHYASITLDLFDDYELAEAWVSAGRGT